PLGRVGVGASDAGLAPPRAHRGEPRVLADLDAPPLVVGQVQVQPVELMERGEIDELLHELLRHEVPRHVQVHAAPPEPRGVLDRYGGNGPDGCRYPRRAEDGRREQLAQGLDRVERACRLGCADGDASRSHVQAVPLSAEGRQRGVETDGNDAGAARSRSYRPDEPPWPPARLTLKYSGFESVLRARSFATHFDGSQYITWESLKDVVTSIQG